MATDPHATDRATRPGDWPADWPGDGPGYWPGDSPRAWPGEIRWNGTRRPNVDGVTTTLSAPKLATVSLGVAAAIGLAAGLLGGLFGVGGGLVIVPALIAVARMDRRLAHGTSLAATLPISVASLATYLAHGNVDWTVAAILTAGSVVGAIVGTNLLRVISKRWLTIIFVVTVLATAVRLVTTSDVSGRDDLTFGIAVVLLVAGFTAGTLAGLLGIGGGVILVPVMVVLLGVVPVVAKGTSAAVIVPTAIMGTIRNRKHSNADIRTAAIVGGFGALSAIAGASISDRLSDSASNIMFAVLLVAVAITQLLTLRAGAGAPSANPIEPSANPIQPSANPIQPSANPIQPSANPIQP